MSFVKPERILLLALLVGACSGGQPQTQSPQPERTTRAIAGPSISTDSATYQTGSTISVTYAGLPGNLHDWIGISVDGSPDWAFVAWAYTNGQNGDTITFTAPAAGTYVARAYLDDSATILSQSAPFAVTTSSISTDKTSYAAGDTITVTYSGLPGNQHDWLAIAGAGSELGSFVAWVYTNGQTSGQAAFVAPSDGTYVARAFQDDSLALINQSAPFTVSTLAVSTDKTSYASGDTIKVTFSGLPGNQHDWLAIAAEGSDATSFVAWVYTNGQTSGTATLTAPGAGTYVARAFLDDTTTLLTQSASFTVVATQITTDKSSYAPGDPITVTYAGLPGNQHDWVAIAVAGSDTTAFVAWVYTNGQTSGTAMFTAPGAGTYVARALLDDSATLLEQSASFTVVATSVTTDKSSYAPGDPITVTYTGLPGNQHDWLAIAVEGSDAMSFVAWVYTNGQTSGTAMFTAPAAGYSYVARAFLDDSTTLLAASAPFTSQ
jgi:hypothetical protein